MTRHIYPQEMQQIIFYIEALNDAEEKIIDHTKQTGLDPIQLAPIPIVDAAGYLIGYLNDEIGGAWSFTAVKPNFKIQED